MALCGIDLLTHSHPPGTLKAVNAVAFKKPRKVDEGFTGVIGAR